MSEFKKIDRMSALGKTLAEMRKEIEADGRVDLQETAFLLKALAPFENSDEGVRAFVTALREVRADRVITDEESARIIGFLDDLLS